MEHRLYHPYNACGIYFNGKDAHRTKGYVKVGGFSNPIDIFKQYGGRPYAANPELFDGFVIKRI